MYGVCGAHLHTPYHIGTQDKYRMRVTGNVSYLKQIEMQ